MAATQILFEQYTARPRKKIYLDTNIAIRLHSHVLHAAGRAEGKRQQKLITFLEDIRKLGGRVVVSPLVLEELFNVFFHQLTGAKMRGRNVRHLKDFRSSYRTDYDQARQQSLVAYREAVWCLVCHQIPIEQPPGPVATETERWAESLFGTYLQTLESSADVGAMDALHIITGQALGCDAFASYDGDMREFPGITVYIP